MRNVIFYIELISGTKLYFKEDGSFAEKNLALITEDKQIETTKMFFKNILNCGIYDIKEEEVEL